MGVRVVEFNKQGKERIAMSYSPGARLRALIARPGAVAAPGVVDALAARLVKEAGFEAVYMTGDGSAAARLGMPDIGLMTMSEMVDNLARIADASELPVVADADTGYGGPINVRRTVREYERAGVAAMHLEDQVHPKRCGHLEGKRIVPAGEMVSKIKAAVDARRDPGLMIIARTDANAVEGLDAALERAQLYRQAGADMLFVESPTSREQIARIGKSFDCPLLFNAALSGRTPVLSLKEIADYGYKLTIYGCHTVFVAMAAIRQFLAHLRATGRIDDLPVPMAPFRDYLKVLGLPEVQELEARYDLPEQARVRF